MHGPRFGVGDDGRVMPDDDGFAVQPQCTEEDDGFYPPERGGIEHVVFFLAEENLFGGVKHEFQAAGEVFAFVHEATSLAVNFSKFARLAKIELSYISSTNLL